MRLRSFGALGLKSRGSFILPVIQCYSLLVPKRQAMQLAGDYGEDVGDKGQGGTGEAIECFRSHRMRRDAASTLSPVDESRRFSNMGGMTVRGGAPDICPPHTHL